MNPHPVVKDLNVIEQLVLCFLPRRKLLVMDHFILEETEETFRHGIILTVAFAAHALRAAPRRQPLSERGARVLAPTIRMNQRRDGAPAPDLPLQKCLLDEPDLQTLRDRPADHQP